MTCMPFYTKHNSLHRHRQHESSNGDNQQVTSYRCNRSTRKFSIYSSRVKQTVITAAACCSSFSDNHQKNDYEE